MQFKGEGILWFGFPFVWWSRRTPNPHIVHEAEGNSVKFY